MTMLHKLRSALRMLLGRFYWPWVYWRRERARRSDWRLLEAPAYTNSLGNRERGDIEFIVEQGERERLLGPVYALLPAAWLFRPDDHVAWSVEAAGHFWGWQRSFVNYYARAGFLVCATSSSGRAYLRMLARAGVLRELMIGPTWIGEKTPVADITEVETGVARTRREAVEKYVAARQAAAAAKTPGERAEVLRELMEQGLEK